MSFKEQARSRGLNEQTIEALMEEDYTSIEAVLTLRDEDMKEMKIKLAQRALLRKWIAEVNAEQAGEENTAVTVEEKAAVVASTTTANVKQAVEESETAKSGETGNNELPMPDEVSEKYDQARQEVEEYIKQHGLPGIDRFMREKLEEHKDAKVNIGITGQSGAGKSSFINCLRNLKGSDATSASVGVKETTMKVQAYPDPKNKNVLFWDLPGIGTPKFPKATYLDDIKFDNYDLFLILTNTRFQEDDLYLAQQVQEKGRKLFFLRTKFDFDLQNDKEDHPDMYSEDNPDGGAMLMAEIKNDCREKLQEANLKDFKIFVISSRLSNRTRYDFPELMETIVSEAPAAKQKSLIWSLSACSEQGVEEKRKQLEERIPFVAKKAALYETKLGSREDLIKEEIQLYANQLGLTSADIQKMGVDVKTLNQKAADKVGKALGNTAIWAYRGVSSTLSAPSKVVKFFTGRLREEEDQIAEGLRTTLSECVEAAKAIIKQGQK